jgi:Gpi18-like mannosyltransferase
MRAVDLHDEDARKWGIIACLFFLLVLSILVRKSLINFQDPDYGLFSGWYDFVKAHGLHSFKYGYSNYNPPYTYFLYILTILPISKIVALKGLMGIFDIFMAVSVYYVVKFFRPIGYVPLIAAVSTMYLPTVLVTGVMWGQFDQLYVGAALFSLLYALRNNSKWAWIWFGAAIAVKFQAIFFLPVLIILVFRRIRWYDAIWAVGTFLVLTLPPLVAGRSLGSLLGIYPDQTQLAKGDLTLNAPSIYQWFPPDTFPFFYHMGIGVAGAACIFILLYSLEHKKFSPKDILLCLTLVLYVVPFLLPEMHDRYFFPAGIASMILAFAYPSRLYAGIAVLIQVITLFSYSPFIFNATPIPFTVLSLGILLIICLLTSRYIMLPKDGLRERPVK